jgi:hypothetical protein
VGGLPWLNPANVRGVKPEGRKNKNKNKKIIFRRMRPRGAPQGRLRPVGGKFYFFIFFIFLFSSQATSRSAAGPPTPSRNFFIFYFYFYFFVLRA